MPNSNAQNGRDLWQAVKRGALGKCPRCGGGRLFGRFLKVLDQCPACGEAFHHHRADDAPPYFTILIVGHLVVPWVWVLEVNSQPPMWLHLAIWIPLVLAMSLALLPIFKGGIVGMQWATRMHGFGVGEDVHDRDSTYVPLREH